MLTINEIALVLKPGLENGRIAVGDAEKMLLSTKGFDLEEYGFDSVADFLPSLCEDFELDGDTVVIKGKTLECLCGEKPGETAGGEKSDGPQGGKPLPPGPPEGFDVKGMNMQIAKLVANSGKESVPLTSLGHVIKQKGVVVPPGVKLRMALGWSPDIFIQELREEGVYFISLTAKGKKLAAGPVPPPPGPPQVYMSRYALASFCVIAPVNDFLAKLAAIAEPDGWFVIDDPAEKQPYRLLLRKLELDFALAMREELEGRESPFRTGMIRGTYRTGFHDADGRPVYMEMEFNSQRDTSTMAPWKFKRFYVEG